MKTRKTLLGICLLLASPLAAQEKNYVSEAWVADQGNGKYKNPILYADYSDPDACRVGDGLGADFLVTLLMVTYVINIDRLLFSVLHTGKDTADVCLSDGSRT